MSKEPGAGSFTSFATWTRADTRMGESYVEVSSLDDIRAIQALRANVWAEQQIDSSLVPSRVADGHDAHARHLVWRDEHGIQAVGRLCIHDSLTGAPLAPAFAVPTLRLVAPIAFALRLVTAAARRGCGIGTIEKRLSPRSSRRLRLRFQCRRRSPRQVVAARRCTAAHACRPVVMARTSWRGALHHGCVLSMTERLHAELRHQLLARLPDAGHDLPPEQWTIGVEHELILLGRDGAAEHPRRITSAASGVCAHPGCTRHVRGDAYRGDDHAGDATCALGWASGSEI